MTVPVLIVLGFFGLLFLAMIVLAVSAIVCVIMEKIRNRGHYVLSGVSALYDQGH